MMYFIKLWFGVLNATHNEVSVVANCAKTYIPKTTTSLSTVRTVTVLCCLALSATWTIMLLSASSCEQGASPFLSLSSRQTTSSSSVLITCLSVGVVITSLLRKENSLSPKLPPPPHFWGTALFGAIQWRTPFPLFSLACSFNVPCL